MDAALRFVTALDADCRIRPGEPAFLPDRLVRAAAVALPVDGAGLALHDLNKLRTPLSASSAIVAIAERLEFTTGCGPCLAAAESGLPLFATEGLLAHRWPIFHDLLVSKTALRSIVALPLPGPLRGVAAMDLYFRDPAGPTGIDFVEVSDIADLVAEQLIAQLDRGAGTDSGAPSWLATPAARRRGRLWMAVGMVLSALRMPVADALALLRGVAYATDTTVDDLADDLLERRIAPEELRGLPARTPTAPTSSAREGQAPAGRSADGSPIRAQRSVPRVVGSACRNTTAAWDGHVLLLHGNEQERRAGLTAWVRRGLQRGEKVLYTELPNGPSERLLPLLEAGGVDVAAAVRDGQLVVLPPALFYPPEGPCVVAERALVEGFPAVRLSVDARAARSVLSPAAFEEAERRMDELVCTRPVAVMCQYARSTTTGAWLEDVVAAHLTGVHQSTLATGGNGGGLVLHGEIDAANADVFAAVLAAADRAVSRALCLDLTGVTYLDAGAGRRLNDATRRFRAAGGEVVLIAPPPVERTLRLLNLDDLPGLQLVEGER